MMRSLIPDDVVCLKKTGYDRWEDALNFITDTIRDCEGYAVIMDEDMFIYNWQGVLNIANHMIEHGYTHAGIPDRGVIPHRTLQWTTLNPFFNVLNCPELRRLGALDSIDKPSFVAAPLFEIFDDFYIHLYKIGRPLFLNAGVHKDNITTQVMDHTGKPFALHTWYSREFNKKPHRKRIFAVFNETRSLL